MSYSGKDPRKEAAEAGLTAVGEAIMNKIFRILETSLFARNALVVLVVMLGLLVSAEIAAVIQAGSLLDLSGTLAVLCLGVILGVSVLDPLSRVLMIWQENN